MNKLLRFSRRMGDSYPYGAEYGCAITCYGKDGHRWIVPACFVAALCLFLVIAMENFA